MSERLRRVRLIGAWTILQYDAMPPESCFYMKSWTCSEKRSGTPPPTARMSSSARPRGVLVFKVPRWPARATVQRSPGEHATLAQIRTGRTRHDKVRSQHASGRSEEHTSELQ